MTGHGRRATCVCAALTALAVLAASSSEAQVVLVARTRPASATIGPRDIELRLGDSRVDVVGVDTPATTPMTIGIVIDAGPDQEHVFEGERELARALATSVGSSGGAVVVTRVGRDGGRPLTGLTAAEASELITGMAADAGKKAGLPIYDAIAATMRVLAQRPGFRVLAFIGEGEGEGSATRFDELRREAESAHIASFTALMADHNLRGARGRLRYGWRLQELAAQTAGLCTVGEPVTKARAQIVDGVQGLRLIRSAEPPAGPARYEVSVRVLPKGTKLSAQRAVIVAQAR
jgi:hypothetical protein